MSITLKVPRQNTEAAVCAALALLNEK